MIHLGARALLVLAVAFPRLVAAQSEPFCIELDEKGKELVDSEAVPATDRLRGLAKRAHPAHLTYLRKVGDHWSPHELRFRYCVLPQRDLSSVSFVRALAYRLNPIAQFRQGSSSSIAVENGVARVFFVDQDPLDERSIHGRWKSAIACPPERGLAPPMAAGCVDYGQRLRRRAAALLHSKIRDDGAVVHVATTLAALAANSLAAWGVALDDERPLLGEAPSDLPAAFVSPTESLTYVETMEDGFSNNLFAVRLRSPVAGEAAFETRWIGGLDKGRRRAKPEIATVTLADAQVQGKFPVEIVRRIVRGQIASLRECYLHGVARDASLRGRAEVSFFLNRAGAVEGAHAAGASLPDPEVLSCIAGVIGKLSFPPSEDGGANVRCIFTLESGQ
jgi:hypothetical protein